MRAKTCLLLATAVGLVGAAPALAQDAPGTAGDPSGAATATPPADAKAMAAADAGDIIVTARKRQESILRVPVVATVLTPVILQQRQVSTLSDIASLAPGLMLGQAPVSIGTQVSIRGIGTSSLDPGIDQSVSLNLDGLQLSQGAAFSVGVFDMAQVEVLKGPQALFFGKNSPGGVISIRTADPGDKVEVIGRVAHEFEADETRTEAIISGPLTDTLGVRVATMYTNYGGFYRNTATAVPGTGAVDPSNHFGESDTIFARGTILYKPVPNFSARVKLNYTRDQQNGGVDFQLKSCPDGIDNYAGVPFYSANEDCKRDHKLNLVDLDPAAFGGLPKGGRPFTNIQQKFGTVELNYDPAPSLALTSVTGYYDLALHALFNGTAAGGAGPTLAAENQLSRKEFTQELRLNSDFSGPLNVTAGAFYQDGKIKNQIDLSGNTSYGFPPRLQVGSHAVDIRSISAFGQLRYKPFTRFEIAAGVRYTDEKRHDDAASVDIFGVFGTPGAIVDANPPKLHSKNWSPELTLTYTPTDDLTIFGSLKQGYKSGSYNLVQPILPGADNSFGDERIRGGEAGLKGRVLDHQLYFNLAGYYYNYKGLQVGVNTPAASGLPVVITQNAGSARIYGVDFDFSYRPLAVPGLSLRGAIDWNKAKFTKFEDAPCWGGQTFGEGCDQLPRPLNAFNPVTNPTGDRGDAIALATGNFFTGAGGTPFLYSAQNLSGIPLSRAPRWQLNLGATYEMPVGNGMKVTLGVDGQYTTRYLADLGRRRDFYEPSYTKINANISLTGPKDGWEVAFIANNLTDKLRAGNCYNANYGGSTLFPGAIQGGPAKGPSGSDEVYCGFDRGRELWLRLTLKPAALFGS